MNYMNYMNYISFINLCIICVFSVLIIASFYLTENFVNLEKIIRSFVVIVIFGVLIYLLTSIYKNFKLK